jgi:CSLREA domain-containing protein
MRIKLGLIVTLIGGGFLVALLLAGAGPTWAGPAGGPFTVNSLADTADNSPGDGVCETAPSNSTCTLRAAIQEANAQPGADSISFSITGTVSLLASLPAITDSVTIIGPGPADLKILASFVAPGGILGLTGPSNAHYVIVGLEFRGNNSHAGLAITHGTLSLANVRFYQAGMALAATSPLALGDVHVLIARTDFDSNSASAGGAIYNLNADVVVLDSTFQNNQSYFGGGAIYNSGTTIVRNSTFVNNTTGGGGLGGNGGALYNTANNHLTLVNSTVASNTVVNNGSASGGGLYNAGTLTLANVTVSGNTAQTGLGGGLAVGAGSTTTLHNSIIANSPQGGDCLATGATVTNGGYNLVEDNSCGFSGGSDPLLGGLADNGGPTRTQALQAGSPALDAGDPAGCANPAGGVLAFDQRGYLRSVDGDANPGARCDLGAFEYLSTALNLPIHLFVPIVLR